MLGTAIARGVKIELCYSQAILSSDPSAKRTLISNVVQLIRVTRGRGLLFSSEARNALGLRAPTDVINLASVWGLGHERGKDGLTKEARSVVEFARLKRTSYRGVMDVVHGGEKQVFEKSDGNKQKGKEQNQNQKNKRKAEEQSGKEKGNQKGQQKRDKKARTEANS
jgi:ribonuclease P/MRP protein subunit RPP1